MPPPESKLYRGVYKGIRMPNNSVDAAIDAVENFECREDDVLLTGYNKSGTHWMNEVMQLIFTDGDPSKLDHRHRRDILEITEVSDLRRVAETKPTLEFVKTDPSPRVLKTHLRPQFLPKETWEKKIPIVYVLRNPKDVFISLFNFLSKFTDQNGEPCLKPEDFDEALGDYIAGNVPYDGWFDHVTSYEALIGKVDHIMFVTYEEMKKDLPAVIKTVAKHIGHVVTDEVVDRIVENTTVEAMKRNYARAMESRKQENPNNEQTSLDKFISKGVAGRWKTEHSEDQWRVLDEVFKEKVKNTTYAKQYFQWDKELNVM